MDDFGAVFRDGDIDTAIAELSGHCGPAGGLGAGGADCVCAGGGAAHPAGVFAAVAGDGQGNAGAGGGSNLCAVPAVADGNSNRDPLAETLQTESGKALGPGAGLAVSEPSGVIERAARV